MKLKITITPEDFDKAIAVPWDTCTCLFSQAGPRNGLNIPPDLGNNAPGIYHITNDNCDARRLMAEFDSIHTNAKYTDSETLQKQYAALRAKLPVTFETE